MILLPGRSAAGDNRRVPDAEMPDAEMEAESRATDRLTLFSDAVVAIAITLLAIDLPVPEGGTVPLFWESVRHNGGHYAAFLISFFAIAAAWRDHHDIFKYVRRVDSRLRTLNTFWLLMIVLNPFATKLLTAPGHPDLHTHALRFGFYALLQVLESATVFVMPTAAGGTARPAQGRKTQRPGESAAGRHRAGGIGDPVGPGADVERGGDAGQREREDLVGRGDA